VATDRGDVTREDIQKAREIFGKFGFKGLRDNLGKGILPAAAAGLFLMRRPDGGGGGGGSSREES
jgi:hypothetical protein